MKSTRIIGWSSALCLCAMALQAQETNEVGELKKQVELLLRVQREQNQQIQALSKKLEDLTKSPIQPKTDEQKKLEQDLAAELSKDISTNSVRVQSSIASSELAKPWS